MTSPYRDHCSDWHDTDFIKADGDSSSLYLENVKFLEIRARYKNLIYLRNSHNLILQNTHFEKIEVRHRDPSEFFGVVKIEEYEYESMQCPVGG